MSQGTAGNVARKDAMEEYGFTFGQDGTWNDPPKCDFCGKGYQGLGVQITMECGMEICPDCFLEGPKVAARMLLSPYREDARIEGQPKYLLEIAEVIGRLDTFTQLPRGIMAQKIAEAYFEEAGREV